MVKIEQLKSAKAVFTRNGLEQSVFQNFILTDEEYKTLRVLEGAVVVSIDEAEVITINADANSQQELAFTEPTQEPVIELETKTEEPSKPAVEVAEVAAPKVIIQPKPRSGK